jgi:hypothetical protein
MGEQQKNAMQESELNQQKSLEEILTAQQTRSITGQKAPLELERMRSENAMFPAKQKELDLKNQETETKISRQAYQDYLDELAKTPMGGTLEDKLSYVNATNKKHKIDPESPMSMIAVKSLQDPQAWQKLWDGVSMGGTAAREKTAQQGIVNEGNLAREREQQAGSTERTRMTVQGQKDTEQMRIDAGKYQKANTLKVGFQSELAKAKNAIEKMAVVRQYMALAENDPDLKDLVPALNSMAQQLMPQFEAEVNKYKQAGIDVGGMGLPTVTNKTPVPQVGATAPAAPSPQAGPKQLSPQDQQAAAWAQANPNDPRAAAIRQKLGL